MCKPQPSCCWTTVCIASPSARKNRFDEGIETSRFVYGKIITDSAPTTFSNRVLHHLLSLGCSWRKKLQFSMPIYEPTDKKRCLHVLQEENWNRNLKVENRNLRTWFWAKQLSLLELGVGQDDLQMSLPIPTSPWSCDFRSNIKNWRN